MTALTVRRPLIDIAALELPDLWLAGDAFRTHLFNTLSQSFPVGERYFIDAVREALPLIQDPLLAEEIRLFIGQEATHSGLHRRLNTRLDEQGLRNWVEPAIGWRVRLTRRMGVKGKLAITMAYEHFTATLGDALLRHPEWLDGVSEPMRVLWQWHAVEECEHRAVAAHAYHALGGGEIRRVGWFFYASLMFLLDTSLQTIDNIRRSGHFWRMTTWRQAAAFLFGRSGVVWELVPAALAYLRPGFVPRNDAADAQARHWLEQHAAWLDVHGTPSHAAHLQAPPPRA
jgi:predicted metal-dependent hydrolase